MLSTKTIFTQRNTYRDSGRRRALLAAEAAVAVEAVVVEAVVVGEEAGAGVSEAGAGLSEAGAGVSEVGGSEEEAPAPRSRRRRWLAAQPTRHPRDHRPLPP